MTDVKVEQCDRDAAANAVQAYRDQKNANWQQRIRDGKCDDGEMVQAFARHRQAAEKATRERDAGICEDGLMLTHDGYDLTGFQGPNGKLRAAATAIRSQNDA